MTERRGESGRVESVDQARPLFRTAGEIYAAAKQALPHDVWNHLDGAAGDETTARKNLAAFDQWEFRPRILAGNGPPVTATSFMGIDLALPILSAPFGSDRLFHPDGHLAVARANRLMGIASIVSGAGSYSLEAVHEAAPESARLFQLHSVGSTQVFLELAQRAIDAGYSGLCITADCPTRGWRERMMLDDFTIDVAAMKGNYLDSAVETLGQLENFDQPVWTWDKLGDVCARLPIPFMVKGVLTSSDAEQAVQIGASAVMVSNHGGRQLDGSPATLTQLPEIVEQVRGRCEIALDGGIRRATDIIKALGQGAQVVVAGRAIAMALAAAGEQGVVRLLTLWRAELETSMVLLGCPDVKSIDRSFLQERRVG